MIEKFLSLVRIKLPYRPNVDQTVNHSNRQLNVLRVKLTLKLLEVQSTYHPGGRLWEVKRPSKGPRSPVTLLILESTTKGASL